MRRKLVIWGSDANDKKILVALELLEKENVVNIYTFNENIATEQFYKEMSEKWKDDIDVEFPEGFTKIVQKLSVSDSILPEDIKVDRTDLITRAQTEWHFVVLSSKLYHLYKSELEEFKEKVDTLTAFDNNVWSDLKSFWNKVQEQVNERNLFREHGASLREKTNSLFEGLKSLRKDLELELEKKSKDIAEKISEEINEIEEKIEKGLGLSPLFEELKNIQTRLKDYKFTKEDRLEVWKKVDEAFKKLKEKRGVTQQAPNNQSRILARYNGLLPAIAKMQKSIDLDKKDLDYQNKRVGDTDGQLESLLRVAKINMIEERMRSKQEKLEDMLKTKSELESKIEKETRKMQKVAIQEKVEEAKEIVKQKIADQIAENTVALESKAEDLSKAAEELSKSKTSSIIESLSTSIEQLVEDVTDTVKAVAEVAEDKIEEYIEKAEAIVEDIKEKFESQNDESSKKEEDHPAKQTPSSEEE